MSKRGAKRKAEADLASDESDGLFVSNTSHKTRKTTRGKRERLARLEEYDEDEGRAGSRGFQKWAELFENSTKGETNKSKTFMKNFQSRVKKNVDDMREYMQQQEDSLKQGQDKYVAIFQNLFSAAIDPSIAPNVSSKGTAITKKEGHVLYKETQDILSKSTSLLKQFTEMEEKMKKHKVDFPTARWKQDKQDIKELLDLGRQHGEQLAESLLVPNIYPSTKPDQSQQSDNEKLASDLFKDSRKALEGDTWGTVAAEQVKRFKALAKTVPLKDQGPARY
ncbi:hypothetical protein F5X99DRAFT_413496 [Biscogniauxia marginata]|nr:hypothetical protein F5X99DRAFT_413496 [Biscogniauxia marginata]